MASTYDFLVLDSCPLSARSTKRQLDNHSSANPQNGCDAHARNYLKTIPAIQDGFELANMGRRLHGSGDQDKQSERRSWPISR